MKYAYTKSTNPGKPHSYHVVYNIKSTLAQNKFIALAVNRILGFEIIDFKLYSIGKSLRLPNCYKCDTEDNENKGTIKGQISPFFHKV